MMSQAQILFSLNISFGPPVFFLTNKIDFNLSGHYLNKYMCFQYAVANILVVIRLQSPWNKDGFAKRPRERWRTKRVEEFKCPRTVFLLCLHTLDLISEASKAV